ncbi:hypothetical protein B0H13DRAFT_1878837 [Mycena leptocephala]|nr:hypothetical protein B0H13DRAFT_1878837 [Mycena leptocephala]
MEVHIVGKIQRVEIEFEIVKIGWYEIYENTEIETLYREFIERIGPELRRNSEGWGCYQCGCDECAPKMQQAAPLLVKQCPAESDSKSQTIIGTILMPDGMGGGLSGACLTCGKEQTTEFTMSRCAKCKLVRYSTRPSTSRSLIDRCAPSVACQKVDWARHKTICGTVQSVSRSDRTGKERETS